MQYKLKNIISKTIEKVENQDNSLIIVAIGAVVIMLAFVILAFFKSGK